MLTVAGHDHLVAAAALGAGGRQPVRLDGHGRGAGRSRVAPPPPRVVAGLVSRGLSVYPHVVDSTTCLLGALRTGLVLGRALDTLGATTIEQRLAFDAGARPGVEPADVTVEGLDMADDHVTVGWPEGTDPLAAWAGVLARTREVVASEVAAMRAVGVLVDDVVVTGGGLSPVGPCEPGRHRGADPPRDDGGTRDTGAAPVRAVGGHPASGGVRPDHARGPTGALVRPTRRSRVAAP